MKKIKTITATVFFLLAAVGAWAQSPDLFFEQQFPYHTLTYTVPRINPFDDQPDCFVTEVAPDGVSEGYYLLMVNHGRWCGYFETQPVSPTLVYKLSMQGELLGQLRIGYDDRGAYVNALFHAPDDPQCFLAVGYVHDNELHYDRPFLARFDHNLNLMWRREVELPEAYRNTMGFFATMDSQGNIFCSATVMECGNDYAFLHAEFSRFYFRLTPEGVLDGCGDLPFVSYYQNVFEFPDGSGDYGLLEEVWGGDLNHMELVLLRVDRNLEIVDQRTIPERYEEMDPTNTYPTTCFILSHTLTSTSERHAMAWAPDGSMVLGNEASVTYQGKDALLLSYDGVGFIWVNPEGEAVSYAMDWKEKYPQNDSLVLLRPMLPAGDDSFYFVYSMGQTFGQEYINCFVVGKMDWEGNLLWRRYWNRYLPQYGMKVYFPQNASASLDGGCLIAGFSYRSPVNAGSGYVYQPDVFLLKFFADGTLSVPEAISTAIRPYGLFPNPVEDVLHLEYSPDVTPRQVALYDLVGRLLYTQSNDLGNVRMGQLPAGTYTLRITMEDGTTYSDRVVKQ